MNHRLLLGILLGVALSVPLYSSTQQVAGQQAVAPAVSLGRYQITLSAKDGPSTVFVFDSHTGRCWYRSTIPDDKWFDMGSPLSGPPGGRAPVDK
jgi:hypothetical protein